METQIAMNDSPRPPLSVGPVAGDQAGTRLDKWLAGAVADLSRERLKALIKQGRVRADGETITDPSYGVKPGQTFDVDVPEPISPIPKPEEIPLVIAYEDEALIVVNKPAGLVVHPAPGNPDHTLVNALIHHCGASLSGIGGVRRPGIVHRLDKDTSGLMVVAKTDAAHHSLAADFAARRIDRTYLALVWGVPAPSAGKIEGNIGRSPKNRRKMAIVSRGGREALTRFRVEERFGDAVSLVQCKLATGRTHQIRVHMTHIGHPIVGDATYGRAPARKLRSLAMDTAQAISDANRQLLHAATLGFRHPSTEAVMSFDSDLPVEFETIITKLKRTRHATTAS
jgi:23S rRNA pseudouridine1911/1915/1917 synthase